MLAVLVRCLIAPGLMIDPWAAARGELKLVICTPSGAKSVAPSSEQAPGPDRRSDGELCSYAASGHAGTAANPVALDGEPPSPAFGASLSGDAHNEGPSRGFAARAPPTGA